MIESVLGETEGMSLKVRNGLASPEEPSDQDEGIRIEDPEE